MPPEKQVYVSPMLEPHKSYLLLTGISLPIGTSAFGASRGLDFLENMDFMEGEQ